MKSSDRLQFVLGCVLIEGIAARRKKAAGVLDPPVLRRGRERARPTGGTARFRSGGSTHPGHPDPFRCRTPSFRSDKHVRSELSVSVRLNSPPGYEDEVLFARSPFENRYSQIQKFQINRPVAVFAHTSPTTRGQRESPRIECRGRARTRSALPTAFSSPFVI